MLVRAVAPLLPLALAAACASAPTRPVDLTELGVADAAELIRSRKVSSVELTQAYLARRGQPRSQRVHHARSRGRAGRRAAGGRRAGPRRAAEGRAARRAAGGEGQ